MDVRRSAVFTCVFRINTAAVTKCAGFPLIFFNEFVLLDETDADAAYRGAFHMAIPAGSVAAPAGFSKLFIKCL